MVAMYEYQAQGPEELQLAPGDLLVVIEKVDDVSFMGYKCMTLPDKRTFFFHHTYTQPRLTSGRIVRNRVNRDFEVPQSYFNVGRA